MSASSASQTNSSASIVVNVPQGMYTRIIAPAGATIGEIVPDLPGGSEPVSSAVPEKKPDTRKQIRLTPESSVIPEIKEATVIHLEGGMLFKQALPKFDYPVELHAHSGCFLPDLIVGWNTSVTLDSGAMGNLILMAGGSAYVANGGKAQFVENGGYARCARDKDVTYFDQAENGPREFWIQSGQSMTLHDGASARIRIESGGYAYLTGANYGYGAGDMPAPVNGATDVDGTIKVLNGCVTEMRLMSGGQLIASGCCIEGLHVSSGGTATVTKGSIDCTVSSGGTLICKGVEIDSIRAYKGADVRLIHCVKPFHRASADMEEFFSVIGEPYHG